jgi:hypothetical protein
MSITFPTFTDKEIPSPEKFNNFVQALEAKFTAGLGSAEIQWPLVAGGNLIMGDYQITGAQKIWSVVNAAEYDTFALALVAGASGCIFIPPNTTIEMDGEEFAGSSLTIIGSGPTSVLKVQSGATSGYLMRNTTIGCKVHLSNLTLNGNSVGASNGLVLQGASQCFINKVWFTSFGGAALKLDGNSGTPSNYITISDCNFVGSNVGISMTDAMHVDIGSCNFATTVSISILGDPADASAQLEQLKVHDCNFKAVQDSAIKIVGGSGTYSTNWSVIEICDNTIDCASMGASDIAIQLGGASEVVQDFKIDGNIVDEAPYDAISVYGQKGSITGNNAESAGQHGINCTTSAYVYVSGNNLQGATNYGVKAVNASTDVVISNNNLLNCTSGGLDQSATVTAFNNAGQTSPTATIGYYVASGVQTLTIPANVLKVGSCINIKATCSGNGSSGQSALYVGGKAVSSSDNTTSTGKRQHEANYVVTAATSGTYWSSCHINARTTSVGTGAVTGVDITGSVDVKIDKNTLTGATYQGILVTLSSVGAL